MTKGNLAQITKTEFSKVKPMACGETISHPYTAQNILEDQLNFPQFHFPLDKVDSIYSDRMKQWDREKYEKLLKKYFNKGKGFSSNMKKTSKFLEEYFGIKIDGFRIVRFTNVSSGYPVWRFDIYTRGKKSPKQEVYSGQEGPLMEKVFQPLNFV
ncbi:MAG: hypothetical protein WC413_00745 [Candidatus Nanoarchaeia archaeon]